MTERARKIGRALVDFWTMFCIIFTAFTLSTWVCERLWPRPLPKPFVAANYWDAHDCINHLNGARYDATADKLSEFPAQDKCREYVGHKVTISYQRP